MEVIGPAYGARASRRAPPDLVAQLDAEFAAREAERGVEPELEDAEP